MSEIKKGDMVVCVGYRENGVSSNRWTKIARCKIGQQYIVSGIGKDIGISDDFLRIVGSNLILPTDDFRLDIWHSVMNELIARWAR